MADIIVQDLVEASGHLEVERVDVLVSEGMSEGRDHPAIRALGFLSEVADQAPAFATCGAVLAFGLATGRPRAAEAGARMLCSVLVATALKSAVKALVSRTRPAAVSDGQSYGFSLLGPDGPEDHSFPSGHTADAVAAARAVGRVYPAATGAGYALAGAIALIQLPRGKHYPLDLAAGAVVGLVSEAVVARAFTRFGPDDRQRTSGRYA